MKAMDFTQLTTTHWIIFVRKCSFSFCYIMCVLYYVLSLLGHICQILREVGVVSLISFLSLRNLDISPQKRSCCGRQARPALIPAVPGYIRLFDSTFRLTVFAILSQKPFITRDASATDLLVFSWNRFASSLCEGELYLQFLTSMSMLSVVLSKADGGKLISDMFVTGGNTVYEGFCWVVDPMNVYGLSKNSFLKISRASLPTSVYEHSPVCSGLILSVILVSSMQRKIFY